MLDSLFQKAGDSPRRRQHLNFHSSFQESCQRLLNAIHPNSYIPPHRHAAADKRELLVAVKGFFSLITFDDDGAFDQSICFGTEKYAGNLCTNVGIEIHPDTWHTVIAMHEGSILLEVKEGPYIVDAAKEFAPWAPAVGSSEADDFMVKCYEFAESQ